MRYLLSGKGSYREKNDEKQQRINPKNRQTVKYTGFHLFFVDNEKKRDYTISENKISPIGEATTGIWTAAAKQWRHCQLVGTGCIETARCNLTQLHAGGLSGTPCKVKAQAEVNKAGNDSLQKL